MNELKYAIKHGGLPPSQLLETFSRRGFLGAIARGLATVAASNLCGARSTSAEDTSGPDFTIAIIPDPQFLAASCPDSTGVFYAGVTNWITDHRHMNLTSGLTSFDANIKAVVGVGDCVNEANGQQYAIAEAAGSNLDNNEFPFITCPGNHDYYDLSSRSGLSDSFKTGYFSALSRSKVFGSGMDLGNGDAASWVGSYDGTGANTAIKLVISGIEMLILSMDFFAGDDAWNWAYKVTTANSNAECYITTHAWLTSIGTQFQRTDPLGPNDFSMPGNSYSNSSAEAWCLRGVSSWPNLVAIFSGHDVVGVQNPNPSANPAWYWQRTPVESSSHRRQTVQQVFANSQGIDNACSTSSSIITGAGQIASVFLITRRPSVGLLEGRMISTYTDNWFGQNPASSPNGTGWSISETPLFSIPFPGISRTRMLDKKLSPEARQPQRVRPPSSCPSGLVLH